MSGVISCDIDGTLTSYPLEIPEAVCRALERAYQQGWKLIFITGRPFVWGVTSLQKLSFPYFLAVINGANVIQMPEQKLVEEVLVAKEGLERLEAICSQLQTDFVAYSGFSGQDVCYYRPSRFPRLQQQEFLRERRKFLGEKWEPVANFLEVPLQGFASIKCFGTEEECHLIAQHMEKELSLHAPVIRDPYCTASYVVQGTHFDCTKGKALRRFLANYAIQGPIIAAGDDYNDLSMIKEADIRIVMESAPEELLLLADIIAPAANKGGLAPALDQAIARLTLT